jgi:inorganic triphosphatase YgiF
MHERMVDHQETEWQFEAADLERVESWLERHPSISGLSLISGATRELNDTYYDTEDWRLYRAGYALRVRRDGESLEATMKSLAAAEGELRRRREISEPLDGRATTPKRARGPVGERLRMLAGARDLRPLFEVRTRRRTFALRPESPSAGAIVEDPSGDLRPHAAERGAIGEIALDEAQILGDGGEPTRLGRVEVEAASSTALHDGIEELVDELREALNLRPTDASKFETGLSAAGLTPPRAPNLGSKERSERSGGKDER